MTPSVEWSQILPAVCFVYAILLGNGLVYLFTQVSLFPWLLCTPKAELNSYRLTDYTL